MPRGKSNKEKLILKLRARFGRRVGKPFKLKLRYSKQVTAFIRELDEANKRAGKSKLRFGQAA